MAIICHELTSPIASLMLAERTSGAVVGVAFAREVEHKRDFLSNVEQRCGEDARWLDAPDTALREQLEQYMRGARRDFDIPLDPGGTGFQARVWRALCEIPYGKTQSYADLACAIGNPRAVRAVARANGQNPIAVVIPCHRVIGKGGSLTGYAGGLATKRALLDLESRIAGAQPVLPFAAW